jgi:hypothetical protein
MVDIGDGSSRCAPRCRRADPPRIDENDKPEDRHGRSHERRIMTVALGVFGRRSCAALAACSAVLHGVSVGHATSAAAVVVMVAMAAVCLYCAHDLWRSGTSRAWVLVATMNIAMVAFHMPTAGHHHGGAVVASASPGLSTAMTTAMTVATVIAAVEVVAAVAVLCQRSRGTAGRLASP